MAGLFGFLIFRLGATQAGGMGLVGLGLAIIGVYGVVSFGASLRARRGLTRHGRWPLTCRHLDDTLG